MRRPKNYMTKRIQFSKSLIEKGYNISYLANLFNVTEVNIKTSLKRNVSPEEYLMLMQKASQNQKVNQKVFPLTVQDVLEEKRIYEGINEGAQFIMGYEAIETVRHMFYKEKSAQDFFMFYVTSNWVAPLLLKYPFVFWGDFKLNNLQKEYISICYYFGAIGYDVEMFYQDEMLNKVIEEQRIPCKIIQ